MIYFTTMEFAVVYCQVYSVLSSMQLKKVAQKCLVYFLPGYNIHTFSCLWKISHIVNNEVFSCEILLFFSHFGSISDSHC